MKATISYFIKSCILDSTTTNDTCPILMQEICDKFLIDNSIKIYIINKDIGIECIARLLFFWDNIFLFDKFQNLLKPLYMQFESDLMPLSGIDLKEYLSNLEKSLIEKALLDSGGVVARAADRLQLGRTTLVEKMRKYNLQKSQESES